MHSMPAIRMRVTKRQAGYQSCPRFLELLEAHVARVYSVVWMQSVSSYLRVNA